MSTKIGENEVFFCTKSIFLAKQSIVAYGILYIGQFPQDGENGQNVAFFFFFFLELCCDQSSCFFQPFSTVLKRFCPSHSKNVFILVLAHLEPELELFGVDDISDDVDDDL